MIKSLYPTFQHWSDGGRVWLISDPHFNSKESLEMNPNYLSASNPDVYVQIINKNICKQDTLICLGDLGDANYIADIKCNKRILIKGNHDKGSNNYKRIKNTFYFNKSDYETPKLLREYLEKEFPHCDIQITDGRDWFGWRRFNEWVVTIDNKLFDEIYDGALFISDQILLSHEPINGLKFCTNIHGHWHSGRYDYTDHDGGRHLNIAADVIDFIPIDLDRLIKAGLISKLPTIHRLAIDKQIGEKE